jgi:hypothetical protein
VCHAKLTGHQGQIRTTFTTVIQKLLAVKDTWGLIQSTDGGQLSVIRLFVPERSQAGGTRGTRSEGSYRIYQLEQ